jgi:type I restriction enzyme S subunit
MSATTTLPNESKLRRVVPIDTIARHHSGNSKLIKGKLHNAPAENLFAAFSASGQDVWHTEFDREGDAIIISAVGARCGKCFLARGQWSAIANTHVIWPDPNQVELKFLWYLVNDEQFWIRSGSAQPFVAVRKTFEKEIFLPSVPEQRRIVAEIEKQFTRLEAGVAALRRVQANLKRYRAAVLKTACEGKLDSVEVPASRLVDLRLSDICESITDGDHQPPPKRPQGIPLLTIGNISSGKLDFSDTRFVPEEYYRQIKPNRIPRPNEILYSVVGATIGIPVLVNTDRLFCFSRHIALLKPSSKVLPRFLWLLMASPQTLREAWKRTTGSAQPTLALKPLRELPIKLPPLAEQTRIVAEVERRLSVVEELEAVVSANLRRATRLRQSILQKAFTGELI